MVKPDGTNAVLKIVGQVDELLLKMRANGTDTSDLWLVVHPSDWPGGDAPLMIYGVPLYQDRDWVPGKLGAFPGATQLAEHRKKLAEQMKAIETPRVWIKKA